MITELERKILNDNYSEMTESEVDFLFKLLDKHKPVKLVEVGVAAGGTTATIIEHISHYAYICNMYSIDKSVKYYRDISLETGYLAKKYIKKSKRQNHHEFLLGKYSPEYFDYIKDDIDFLILDTVHSLPGELLDFIAFLPHLKENAIVVLHDTCLNHRSNNSVGFATQLLLDVVSGEKYFDLMVDNGEPNIGAFRITSETRKNINDVFRALLITWNYMLDEEQICIYRNEFRKHYDQNSLNLFEMAVSLNKKTISKYKLAKANGIKDAVNFVRRISSYRIYIYGNGYFGKKINDFLQDLDVNTIGYIISDDKKINIETGTMFLSEYVKCKENNDLILIGVSDIISSEIEKNLISIGIYNYLKVPKIIFEVI